MSLPQTVILGSWTVFCFAVGLLTAHVLHSASYEAPTPTPEPEPEPEPARLALVPPIEVWNFSRYDAPFAGRLLKLAQHTSMGGWDEYGGDSGDEQPEEEDEEAC